MRRRRNLSALTVSRSISLAFSNLHRVFDGDLSLGMLVGRSVREDEEPQRAFVSLEDLDLNNQISLDACTLMRGKNYQQQANQLRCELVENGL